MLKFDLRHSFGLLQAVLKIIFQDRLNKVRSRFIQYLFNDAFYLENHLDRGMLRFLNPPSLPIYGPKLSASYCAFHMIACKLYIKKTGCWSLGDRTYPAYSHRLIKPFWRHHQRWTLIGLFVTLCGVEI